jgi:hypothetical protein
LTKDDHLETQRAGIKSDGFDAGCRLKDHERKRELGED